MYRMRLMLGSSKVEAQCPISSLVEAEKKISPLVASRLSS